MKKNFIYSIVSVFAFALLYIFTAIIVILTLFCAAFNLKPFLRLILRFWGQFIFILVGKRLKIVGKENIEKNHKYILVANHSSLFDIPAIMSFYPNVSWFGREYLLKIPVFGKALKMTGYIPMKFANVKNTKQMLQQLIQKTDASTIAMFPEGTRTMTGKINRFHRGFIYLMKTAELDLLPVTLNGLYSLKPKTRMAIDFFAKTSLTVHKPLPYKELIELSDEQIIEKVKSLIESTYFA
jgi:1-acyl-sn-glycerol-3-phosphate acyltransferase